MSASRDHLKVLILNGGFDYDVWAMGRANTSHEIKVLSHLAIDAPARKFFPPDLQAHLDGNSDDEGRLDAEGLSRWIQFNEMLFESIRSQFPFDIFLVPSDLFWWLRRFIRIARSRGVPTVVLDKEGTRCEFMMSPEITGWHGKHMPFISDLLIVPTERMKEWWAGTGAPREKIVVTGQTRYDIYVHREGLQPLEKFGVRKLPGRKMILFIGYHRNCCCMTPEEFSQKDLWITTMRDQTVEVFLNFLRRHPEVDLVAKFHPTQDQEADGKPLEQQLLSDPALPVSVVRGHGGICELLASADAVVGFSSTSVAEAMAIGKPTVFTFWSDLWQKFGSRTLPHHESGGCEVARSSAELDSLLEQALFSPSSLPDRAAARRRYLDEHLGPVDGRCAERAWKEIESFWVRWSAEKLGGQASLDYIETLERMRG